MKDWPTHDYEGGNPMLHDRVAAFVVWASTGDPRAEWVMTRAEARDLLDRIVLTPEQVQDLDA